MIDKNAISENQLHALYIYYPLRSLYALSEFTHLYGTRNLSVNKRPYIYGSLRTN